MSGTWWWVLFAWGIVVLLLGIGLMIAELVPTLCQRNRHRRVMVQPAFPVESARIVREPGQPDRFEPDYVMVCQRCGADLTRAIRRPLGWEIPPSWVYEMKVPSETVEMSPLRAASWPGVDWGENGPPSGPALRSEVLYSIPTGEPWPSTHAGDEPRLSAHYEDVVGRPLTGEINLLQIPAPDAKAGDTITIKQLTGEAQDYLVTEVTPSGAGWSYALEPMGERQRRESVGIDPEVST